MRFTLAAFTLMFLCSCSIYKSAQRKDFENTSPENVKSFAALGSCAKAGAIPVWIEREFPGHPVELIVSDSDLEVRKLTLNNGRVVVRSDRSLDDGGFESCRREFSGELEWLANRAAYLAELGVPPLD